jgi:hypothetical protein
VQIELCDASCKIALAIDGKVAFRYPLAFLQLGSNTRRRNKIKGQVRCYVNVELSATEIKIYDVSCGETSNYVLFR